MPGQNEKITCLSSWNVKLKKKKRVGGMNEVFVNHIKCNSLIIVSEQKENIFSALLMRNETLHT